MRVTPDWEVWYSRRNPNKLCEFFFNMLKGRLNTILKVFFFVYKKTNYNASNLIDYIKFM